MEERDILLRLSVSKEEAYTAKLKKVISEEASKPLALPEPYLIKFENQRQALDEGYVNVSTTTAIHDMGVFLIRGYGYIFYFY